jgi:carbon-monoxide dehydrogenase large subunit
MKEFSLEADEAEDGDSQERRFVLGEGRFVDDIKMDRMLHLHFVRSPYARARVLSVNGGINGHELKADMAAVGEDAGSSGGIPFPALPTEYVNYVGQPVAAVLADDRYGAEDEADEVDVQYEPLKPVVDPEKSLESDPIHPGTKDNLAAESISGKYFTTSVPIQVEDTFTMSRVSPNPLETRGVVSVYDGSLLTIYGSTQSVFSWKEGFVESLHLREDMVRVVQMDTGGAFGSKGGIYPEYLVAAYAAMKLRRPVKWVESRYEHLMATNQGRGLRAKMKLFADRSGRIKGMKGDILVDAGAYPSGGSWMPRWVTFQLTGPYSIPKIYVRARAVMTNKVELGPYRGAGRPEAAYFMERIIDRLADEIGIDQAEVRLRNATTRASKSPTGLRIEASKPFLREAFRAFGYASRKRKETLGLSCFVLIPASADGESAKIAIRKGRVKVWLGGSSHGQGHDVFVKDLVSEELGVKKELVDFQPADTKALSGGIGTWGSRTAIVGGGAVIEASRKLKAMAMKKLGKAYSAARLLEGAYEAEAFFTPKESMNSFGANMAAASIGRTGMAVLDEITSYYDVGRVLNPSMLESQIIGGSAQAVGEVLYERALYSEDGQLLTATLAESGVPHSTEMPRFVVKTATHPSHLPHRVKGVGESPTIGVPPAATRALELALGKRLNTLPIDPEQLWAKGTA